MLAGPQITDIRDWEENESPYTYSTQMNEVVQKSAQGAEAEYLLPTREKLAPRIAAVISRRKMIKIATVDFFKRLMEIPYSSVSIQCRKQIVNLQHL